MGIHRSCDKVGAGDTQRISRSDSRLFRVRDWENRGRERWRQVCKSEAGPGLGSDAAQHGHLDLGKSLMKVPLQPDFRPLFFPLLAACQRPMWSFHWERMSFVFEFLPLSGCQPQLHCVWQFGYVWVYMELSWRYWHKISVSLGLSLAILNLSPWLVFISSFTCDTGNKSERWSR